MLHSFHPQFFNVFRVEFYTTRRTFSISNLDILINTLSAKRMEAFREHDLLLVRLADGACEHFLYIAIVSESNFTNCFIYSVSFHFEK